MKNYDEVTHDLLERRDRYVAEQKKKRKRMMGVVSSICCFCLVALIGVGVWRSGMLTTPPTILDNNSTITNNHSEANQTTPSNQGVEQNIPPTNSQGDAPSNPAVTDPPVASQTTPSNPSNPSEDPGGKPNAVEQSKVVNYQDAKNLFGHPIIECLENNFINYEIIMISQHADGDGFYLGVKYIFSDGEITLIDQDRLNASVCGDEEQTQDRIKYNGHTFFVAKENFLSESDSKIQIWYCPKMEKGLGIGIAYSALFDKSVDQTKIMDLILNLEIK